MQISDNVVNIFKIFGVLVGIVTLIFIFLQIRQMRKQTKEMIDQTRAMLMQNKEIEKSIRFQTISNLAQVTLETSKIWIEKPYLHKYLSSNKKLPKGAKLEEHEIACEIVADYLSYLIESKSILGKTSQKTWRDYIIDIWANCKNLQEYVKGRENWYKELIEYCNK